MALILQDCFRSELLQVFDRKRGKNAKYSLRAFARSLGISSGTLSDFLNSKRAFSPKKIHSLIAQGDNVFPRTQELLSRLPQSRRREINAATLDVYPRHNRTVLSQDTYSMISEWHHFAILSLAETKDFRSDPKWIASRLGLEGKVVREAIERLERLELVSRSEKGDLRLTGKSFATSDGAPNATLLRAAQRTNLHLAIQTFETVPMEKRDIFSSTMAIDPTKIPEARRRLRIFMDSLMDFLETGTKTEVYKANFQLFPLSQRNTDPSPT